MNREQQVIAILVDRLGGEVTIAEHEIAAADLEMVSFQDPTQFAWILRTRRKPAVVDGELADARAAIEAGG
jgi:hypothetical protein